MLERVLGELDLGLNNNASDESDIDVAAAFAPGLSDSLLW